MSVSKSPTDGKLHAPERRTGRARRREPDSNILLLQVLEELVLREERNRKVLVELQRTVAALQNRIGGEASGDRKQAAPKSQLGHQQYQQLITRIRAVVRNTVPAGATIAVVSKGDEELLKLDGRVGWHFPQTQNGTYSGHHPANSAEAIAQIEALRNKGAGYLLVPSSAFWWFEHYAEFTKHLTSRYPHVARRDDTCAIFALSPAGAAAGAASGQVEGTTQYVHFVRQIREIVRSTLPPGSTILVISKGDQELVKLGSQKGWHFPQAQDGSYSGHDPADSGEAIAHLEALRAQGAEYLLVPSFASWWLEHYAELGRHVRTRYPLVVRQGHYCEIFELRCNTLSNEPLSSDPGSDSASVSC
jgi:hypothetical protein